MRLFRRKPRHRLRRIAIGGLAAAFALWLAGLIGFVSSLPRNVSASSEPSDAIVVLTGGSERLAVGLSLLSAGQGKKLFISGVHRDVDVAALLAAVQRDAGGLADRIALGHDAEDTVGNARETAAWMAAEGFTSLRLVTAAYHMPRGLYEFARAMPNVIHRPHPVFPAHVHLDDWWRWPGTTVLLASEYSKYLFSRLRAGAGRWFGVGG